MISSFIFLFGVCEGFVGVGLRVGCYGERGRWVFIFFGV